MYQQVSVTLRWALRGLVLLAACAVAGCATVIYPTDYPRDAKDLAARPDYLKCVADFYLPYAALAADSYRSRSSRKERLALFLDTDAAATLSTSLESLIEGDKAEADAEVDPKDLASIFNGGDETFDDAWPDVNSVADAGLGLKGTTGHLCGSKTAVAIPLTDILKEGGWKRAVDVEKGTAIRSWRVFVPDLAVDVWRRSGDETAASGYVKPSEYVIVFRGTTGPGGWFSNLRFLTALLPLVWDQYRQAADIAQRIAMQIVLTECVRSERPKGTIPKCLDDRYLASFRVPITAVGHSLGAGLAKHAFLEVKAISRVIEFNPSPIDGANSLIAIDERSRILAGRDKRPGAGKDPCAKETEAATNAQTRPAGQEPVFFTLFELGDVLTDIAPCVPGPLWGDEGGPVTTCHMVNFLRGSAIKQHGMNRIACALAVTRQVLGEGHDAPDAGR